MFLFFPVIENCKFVVFPFSGICFMFSSSICIAIFNAFMECNYCNCNHQTFIASLESQVQFTSLLMNSASGHGG